MMVVDTSALFAVALDEPQGQACSDALRSTSDLLMSAGTMAEALIVAEHRGLSQALSTLIDEFGIEVVGVTRESARRVADAHRKWGRGVHPAGLNFGDCFAYELAASRNCPLLYIGNDFSRTDIASALEESA